MDIANILFLSMFGVGFIGSVLIGVNASVKDTRKKERQRILETGFDGKIFWALNFIYVFKNNQAYYGYEIMDFKDTVETLEFRLTQQENNTLDDLDRFFDSSDKHLDEEDRILKEEILIKQPLRDDQLKAVSESIISANKDFKFKQEQKRKEDIRRKYQKANYNDDRREKGQYGLNSMSDYQASLKDEYESYDQEYDKQLHQHYENVEKFLKQGY